ncbi:MAG: calycin-like domain-containing protein [Paludibacteraceae bacterium]|nr:calycin-like domain-containing protein [Paludibacteraceae bacterium]
MKNLKSIISLFTAALLGGSASYAAGVYQIPNGNLEMDWTSANEPGGGLHSFYNASLASSNFILNTGKKTALTQTTQTDGRGSGNAVKIESKAVLGIGANGNLTTGNIMMGSSTPSDPSNHNKTNRGLKENGSLEFIGLPDTLEFYSKYKKGKATKNNSDDYNGNVNAFIHGDCDYADPAPNDNYTKEDYVVGYLQSAITPSEDWQRNAIAFEYYTPAKVDMEKDTRYLLMNMTTNPTPGGSESDELIVDDIRFIYNSKLQTLTYDDVDLLNGNKDAFTLTVEGDYDASKLFYNVDGRGATSVASYNEETGVLTITVKGNDIAVDADNFHTYEIQFVPSAPVYKPVLVSAMEFIQWLVVKAEEVLEPVKKVLTVELYDNLKANIKMVDATPAIKADSVAYTKDGDLTLIKGTAEDGTIVDLVAGADTAYGTITVGNTVMEYGKYVLPKIINTLSFEDYLIVDASAPEIKTLSIDLYDNNLATVKINSVVIEKVAYESTETGIKLSGSGVELTISADNKKASGTVVDGEKTLEFGIYTPPTIVDSESYSDTLYAIVNGVASEAELKAITADYYSDNKVVLTIDNLTVGSFDLGKVELAGLAYETVGDSIVISGTAQVATAIGSVIPMTIKSAKTDAEYKGLKAIIGVDLSTLGYIAELKFGYPTEKKSEVVEPEVILIKEASYNDIMKYGKMTSKETVVISYFSNGYATVVLPQNKMFIDSVAYERGADSIRFSATDIIVSGASSIDYSKLQMVFSDGRTFGFAPDTVATKVYNDIMLTYSGKKYGVEKSKSLSIAYLADNTATIDIKDFYRIIGEEKKMMGDFHIEGVDWIKSGDSINLSGDVLADVSVDGVIKNVPVKIYGSYVDADFANVVLKMTLDMSNTIIGETVEATFGLPIPVELVKSVVYNDSLVVKSNGEIVTSGREDLKVDFYDNGYATISLFDFAVDADIVVGDIIVDSVPYTVTDSIRMTATRNVTIAPKLGTIGAALGVLPVEVTLAITDLEYTTLDAEINLDLVEMGEKVNVIFGAVKEEIPEATVVMSATYNDVLNANGELKEAAAKVDYYSDKSVVVKVDNMTLTGLRYTLGDSLRASGNAVLAMAGKEANVNVGQFVSDRSLSKLYMNITAGTNMFRFGYDTIPVVPEIPDTTQPVVPDTTVTPVIPGGNGPKLLRTVVYTDDLVINISGDDMQPQTQDITVAYYDNGMATLSILNFIMGEGEDGMLVGDIVLDSVPYTESDSIRMQILKNIFITSKNPEALGNSLPEIPVEIKSATSSNNFDKLKAVIGIDLEDMYVTVNFGFSDKTNTGVVEENVGPKLLRTVVYTDDLVINISGDDMQLQTQDITVAYYDNGMATLSIMNFVMGEGEDGMLVGDIVLENVPYTESDSIRMQILRNIFITSKNPEALGNSLPEIPVEIKSATSSVNYDKLQAVIGIDLEDMYVTVKFGFSDKTNTGVVEENSSEETRPQMSCVTDNYVVSMDGQYYGVREGNTLLAISGDNLTLRLVDMTVDLGDGDIVIGDIEIVLPTRTSDMIYFEGEDTVKIKTDDVYEIGNQIEYARVKVTDGYSKIGLTKVFYDMEVELIDFGLTFIVNFGDSTTSAFNYPSLVNKVVDTRIYTITGAYVGDNIMDRNMLPVGIYIQNGKKFIVRK